MPTVSAEAEVFLTYEGVDFYHVYKNDDMENGFVRDYSYSLVPDSRDECGEEYQGFDISDLPSYSNDKSYEQVLKDALDNGELDALIEQAESDGYIIRCGESEPESASRVFAQGDWVLYNGRPRQVYKFLPFGPTPDTPAVKADPRYDMIELVELKKPVYARDVQKLIVEEVTA